MAELQELRKAAREANVVIKVVKNRLVRVALQGIDTYKEAETDLLVGQLVYAISAEDEVMPAKVLDTFAKTHPALQLAGGFSSESLGRSRGPWRIFAVAAGVGARRLARSSGSAGSSSIRSML